MIFRWAQCFQRNLFCHFLTNYNIIYNKIIFDIIMSSCLLDAMVLGISCDDSRIFSKSGFISIPSSTSKILFLTLEDHNSLVFSYFSSSFLKIVNSTLWDSTRFFYVDRRLSSSLSFKNLKLLHRFLLWKWKLKWQ